MGENVYVIVPDKKGIYSELNSIGIVAIAVSMYPCIYPRYKKLKSLVMFLPRLFLWNITNLLAVSKIKKIIQNYDINIIHTNVSVLSVGYSAAKALQKPHIFHIREFADKFGYNYFPSGKYYRRQFAQKNNYTICITKSVQKYYSLNEHSNSIVIYDGVFSIKDANISKNKKNVFLYAGRVIPSKGLLPLLRAYLLYYEKTATPLQLFVAGEMSDENYAKQIKDFISMHNLSEHIVLLGKRNDIKEIMSTSLSIIVSSETEGFGLCMAEAMFCGCLVVGKDLDGTKEQFDNGLTLTGSEIGLRYQTEKQLANLLLKITDGEINQSDYIGNAFKVVCEMYTTEKCLQSTSDYYKRILNDNKQ